MNKFAGFLFGVFIVVIIIFLSWTIYDKEKNKAAEDTKINAEELIVQKDLRLGILNIDTFNPILTKNRYVYEYTNLFYDALIDLDENYRLNYELANSIKKINDLEYKIVLKDEIYWNKLKEKLVSKDVEFTIKKIQEHGGIYKENIKNINTVNILDSKSFVIKLKQEDPYFLYNLNFPIMKSVDNEKFVDKEKYGVPYSISMYYLAESKNNTLIFKLNKDYYKFKEKIEKLEKENSELNETEDENIKQKEIEKIEKEVYPYIKEIVIKLYDAGENLYNDFKMGDIDLLQTEKQNVEKYIGNYGYVKTGYKGRDYTFLSFNCKNINDSFLRKSISYVIDKAKILNKLPVEFTETTSPLDFGSWTYTENLRIEPNLDTARLILKEGGYDFRNGKWTKDNNEIVLNILVNNSKGDEKISAEIIKKELEDFGFSVNLIFRDRDTYAKNIIDKNYDLAIITVRNSFNSSLESFFGENNYSNYSNQKVMEKILEARKLNTSSTIDAYKEIGKIYLNDIPFISLYRNEKIILVSSGLNAEIYPNSHNIFQNFEKWYRK